MKNHLNDCYVNEVIDSIMERDWNFDDAEEYCEQSYADVHLNGINNDFKEYVKRSRARQTKKVPIVSTR